MTIPVNYGPMKPIMESDKVPEAIQYHHLSVFATIPGDRFYHFCCDTRHQDSSFKLWATRVPPSDELCVCLRNTKGGAISCAVSSCIWYLYRGCSDSRVCPFCASFSVISVIGSLSTFVASVWLVRWVLLLTDGMDHDLWYQTPRRWTGHFEKPQSVIL